MPSVGENIRCLRKSRGYTQERFAKALNTNQANVTAWERNERKPSYEMINTIASTFHVPVYSILPVETANGEEDFIIEIKELLQKEPRFREFFNKAKFLSHENWDVVIKVADALVVEVKYDG